VIWRDGMLYIPRVSKSHTSMPLLVWLHGGGGRADSFRYLFPLAEEFGVVILALDARHNTWDGIDSPFGPDVQFIDTALQHTFERVAIDP
jgi:phospholipase/carboxylesterase